MSRFRIDSIAELSKQLAFTPHAARLQQLDAAEELLHTLDPTKAYPLDYVIYRVTGYHPRDVSEDLLTGLALQHDLGLLIDSVSDALDLHASQSSEPVLQIDDVCERFNVTSKTIQRWRRKGLPSRRFVFADGKKRVGFLLGSVERFLQTHEAQVARGTNFSQVSLAERDEIVRRAHRLAERCRCCEREIARRIARTLKRSPLTILHTVRRFDAEHPESAVFAQAPQAIGEEDRSAILRSYKRGVALGSLARRLCQPRSAVYRVLLEERLARFETRKIKFIDDPLYHQEHAESIVDQIVDQEELQSPESVEATRVPRDLPVELQGLYRTPLLTPSKERALFLKFNYHKFEFVSLRRRLDPELARARDLNLLESHLKKAVQTKNRITRANLRLVASVARRHLRPGLSLDELMSDGTVTLMRAVEGFDLHAGNRFSTYATFALMKGFARSVPAMQARRHRDQVDPRLFHDLPDARSDQRLHGFLHREEISALLARLSEREQYIIRAHYGLDSIAPSTFEEVAREMGLSQQRVRQIEQTALAKLRAS